MRFLSQKWSSHDALKDVLVKGDERKGRGVGGSRLSLFFSSPSPAHLPAISLPCQAAATPGKLQTLPVVEWAANPFSSSSFWPRNRTRVSWIVGEFFTNWAIREALATKISKAPSQSIFNIFSTTWKTVSLNHDLIPSSMGKENLISRGKQKILLCP